MKINTKTTSFKGFSKISSIFSFVVLVFLSLSASANGGESKEGGFNAGEMIMHHIADAHQIHIIGSIHIPLPVIVYHEGHVDMFMSNKFWNGHNEEGELQFVPYTASSGTTYENDGESIIISNGVQISQEAPIHSDAQAIRAIDSLARNMAEPAPVAVETAETKHIKPIDFSITKSVFGMLLVLTIMFFLFKGMAKSYVKRKGMAPKGAQNLLEPFVLFIRNEVAIPSIGKKKADKYVPFLLTVFFFIWMCNILGLIPFIGGFNITGTLSITIVFAVIVFLITTFSGNAHYWGHIFWPPGVPLGIKLILVPIEIFSIFLKPAVLMIRLTANIAAGHIIILAFVGLILMFGQTSAAAGYGVGVGAVLFMVFMFFIELLVAFLQAYVFTLLTAIYFGDATQEHAHHDEDIKH
jgi:F-type H+-transporting ATPase subunit a